MDLSAAAVQVCSTTRLLCSYLLYPGGGDCFDVLGNLQLLPKFNEKDPETFFSLFECVAASIKWPESACTLMLQCVLTGRAQEVYSSLSFVDRVIRW